MATNFSKAFCMTALFVAIIVNSGCTKIPLSSFAESLHGIEVVLPPNAPRIKSDFNDLRDINGNMRGHRHKGIDIVASVGHPVLAPASGRIKKLDRTKDGLILEIWYSVGYDTIITSYLHLNSVSVEIGNFVKRGQQIATVGKTGSTSGGVPHLHFSVGGGGSQ